MELDAGSGREQARLIAQELREAVAELRDVLSAETALLKASDIAGATALGESKSAAGRRYAMALESVRAHGVALARFASGEVAGLREQQSGLTAILEDNLAVLATLRSVAETIMRGVSRELATERPNHYGPAGMRPSPPARPEAQPLVLSRRL